MANDGRPQITCFKNCEVLRRETLVRSANVWVREGKVIDPKRLFYVEKLVPDRVINCHGLIVAPGFIDIQINGAFGIDFSSLEEGGVREGVDKVREGVLKHGVTAICPTIVTSDSEYYHQVLPQLKRCPGGQCGAALLGVHCEGPFISRDKKGAHREAFIRNDPSPDTLQRCYGSMDNVRIITLAPELQGAVETVRWLREEKGVVVSLGHSMASIDIAQEAVKGGASLITHLFNAMLPFHHRDPGVVGLLTSLSLGGRDVAYSIIADGTHTHETVERIAYKSNPEGAVLITDAIAAMGFPDGDHMLGTMSVELLNGTARLAGKSTLAGSVATMDHCVRHFKSATGCSTAKALQAASLHPAQVLGIESHKGTLEYGADADMVLLDHELCVQATCIAGEVVWKDPACSITGLS